MSNSIQHALSRIRPPRVRITYDVETGTAIEKKELPFLVGVLADLAGENGKNLKNLKERNFIEVDRDNFNQVIRLLNPTISLQVKSKSKKNTQPEKIILNFLNFESFLPGNVVKQVPFLNEMLNVRVGLIDLIAKVDSAPLLVDKIIEILSSKEIQEKILSESESESFPYILGILEEVKLIKENSDLVYLKNLFVYLSKVLKDKEASNQITDIFVYLMSLVSEIDLKLSMELDNIMHHPSFQTLEAAWRGLHSFVFNSETGQSLKIKVLPISKKELIDDLEQAIEFDQSSLFKKVYEKEYGTLGGMPYSCLIGDFSFGRNNVDVKLLRKISSVASASHAPFIASASPELFDLDSFENLDTLRDLCKIFESSELANWNSFRESEDARYVNLVLPKVLTRLPYDALNNPCEEFDYSEYIDGNDDSLFCWGNPAYKLGEKITAAYSTYGWTAAIRGVEGGGKVDDLPTYTFKTSNGDMELKCPTQIAITDRREKELSDLGLISLCHCKGTNYSVFFGSQSVQKPKKYNSSDATANAAISSRLSYLLNASRFAHYMKILMRDKIGSFITAQDIEIYLQNWIAEYVLLSDVGSQETKAEYPLREAQVTVVEVPGNPGEYKSILLLRPHFQLEELTVSLRLVANLGGAQ